MTTDSETETDIVTKLYNATSSTKTETVKGKSKVSDLRSRKSHYLPTLFSLLLIQRVSPRSWKSHYLPTLLSLLTQRVLSSHSEKSSTGDIVEPASAKSVLSEL